MSAPAGRTPSIRWPVAVLGATGAVGQTFIRLLAAHPWFDLQEVAASERSAGKPYAEAAKWLEGPMPASVAGKVVLPCDPAHVRAPIVFSALDAAAAGEVEPAFARAGRFVLSNAKNYRMEPDVPLVIPEVNGDHLAILAEQRRRRGWNGAIVTNANCAATVVAMALAPIQAAFGIRELFVTTMQAVSGAGYPGVPSLDILGNVIPYISDEEDKIERELPKLLGRFDGAAITPAALRVSAQANRVAVEHGHTACLAMSLERTASPEDAVAAMREWRGSPGVAGLPSAPAPPLVVSDDPARPQARRDVYTGGGMAVVVGRVRRDPLLDLRMVALGHNTVRGAAGGSVLNAELLVASGAVARS
jgi:aspartate-semialdehyde dehydrogenase